MADHKNPMIYMDNAATTALRPEASEAMGAFLGAQYANPAAVYRFAGVSAKAVSEARRVIAEGIGALPEELFFTSGGTESDNWVLNSLCEARGYRDCHIITSQIEHHAIINTCKRLEKLGVSVTYLPVDDHGMVDPLLVQKNILPETVLISVMMANNEVGTIEPVKEIGQIAHDAGIVFHTDAVQAFGHIPIDVKDMNIDLLSASAHKTGGPKGCGLLYVRKGIEMLPFMNGGSQERGRRAGTLNVPGIVGFGEASRVSIEGMDRSMSYVADLRDHLIKRVMNEIPGALLNGHPEKRLPGNASFCFEGIEGETLLILLDREGICASSGSACTTGAIDPSHVLIALGRTPKEAKGSLRLTLSEDNTKDEVDRTVDAIRDIINRLRSMN